MFESGIHTPMHSSSTIDREEREWIRPHKPPYLPLPYGRIHPHCVSRPSGPNLKQSLFQASFRDSPGVYIGQGFMK